VAEPTRFLTSQNDDPSRSFGESFKHWCPPTPFATRQTPSFAFVDG
jgi:hypothetical protein